MGYHFSSIEIILRCFFLLLVLDLYIIYLFITYEDKEESTEELSSVTTDSSMTLKEFLDELDLLYTKGKDGKIVEYYIRPIKLSWQVYHTNKLRGTEESLVSSSVIFVDITNPKPGELEEILDKINKSLEIKKDEDK